MSLSIVVHTYRSDTTYLPYFPREGAVGGGRMGERESGRGEIFATEKEVRSSEREITLECILFLWYNNIIA
eukprot:scaffold26682_cov206-Skeletonema_menzelii.AAC.5